MHLAVGDVIVDTLDRCWEIVSTVSGTATIIYNFDFPGSCQECINQFPCSA